MQAIQFYLHCSYDLILSCDDPNLLLTTSRVLVVSGTRLSSTASTVYLIRASKFFRSFDKYVRTFVSNVTVFNLFKCMTVRENDGELRLQWKINTRNSP